MATIRQVLIGAWLAAGMPMLLGGCYLYGGETFEGWPEVRVPRDGGGELVGLVKRSGPEKWPGDSYRVLLRWPSNLLALPRDLSADLRHKEARTFIEKLCEGRDIYVVLESFNDRTGEVYYDLWCKPPKKTA